MPMIHALPLAVLLAGVAPADEKKEKPPAPARISVRGEVVQFQIVQVAQGEGAQVRMVNTAEATLKVEGLGTLRVNTLKTGLSVKEATEKVLEGVKGKDGLVAEGTLRLDGKQLVLDADKVRAGDAQKDRALPLGGVVVEGQAVCGKCDLMKCDDCTLAVQNGAAPVVLDGKLAMRHAEGLGVIVATGKLRLQKDGLIRLDADKVEEKKK
jgi:hypothetical protein